MTNEILEELREQLERVQPSAALEQQLENEAEAVENELGYPALLYKRESVELEPVLQRTMTPADREEYAKRTRRVWAASCVCSNCDAEYITGWRKGGGLYIVTDYDGAGFFPGVPEENDVAVEVEDGEAVICPYCESPVEVTRLSTLPRYGRTRRLMVQDVHTLSAGGVRYTVLVVWLKSRYTGSRGTIDDIDPVEAYILDTEGRLIRMKRHTTALGGQIGELLPHWERVQRVRDPDYIRYFSADAINCTKCGCMPVAPIEPEQLAGTTGEKTGLAELTEEGCSEPITYLQHWRRHPAIENLVKAGWGRMVRDTILYGGDIGTWADLTQRKPARMLGMTRAEVQLLGAKRWTTAIACAWKRYRDTGGSIPALEWNEYRKTLGDELMEVLDKYQVTPERAMHYLQRTRQSGQTLADTWDMSARLGLDMTDPQILFPKGLRATHDRLAPAVAELKKQEESEKSRARFQAVLDRYGHMEWSDGEICIRLPRSLTELVREGATLHHCVGGYGDKHLSGSDVIFFVRHARRPERSWYTLDIRMNAGEPREVQLHGYKNELVHGKELRIPRRVREFCDRWEREVLLPGWKRAQRQAKQPKKQAKKENAA